jgi:ABC-type dipeptide/oligopeptide/nickel transport system permease component
MQQYKIKHLYLSVIIYFLLFITESIAGEAIVEDHIEVPDSVAKIHKILLKNRPYIIQSNGVKILWHKNDKIISSQKYSYVWSALESASPNTLFLF